MLRHGQAQADGGQSAFLQNIPHSSLLTGLSPSAGPTPDPAVAGRYRGSPSVIKFFRGVRVKGRMGMGLTAGRAVCAVEK